MAYNKLNLADGDVLKAEHLAHMEDELARQKSWNELGDKPFGEVPTGGDTLTWKFTSYDDLDETLFVEGVFYPISDVALTMDDFAQGGKMTAAAVGAYEEISADVIEEVTSWVITFGYMVWFTAEDNQTVDLDGDVFTFPKAGIYVNNAILGGEITLTLNGCTKFPSTKKIDAKYLTQPDWNQTDSTAADYIKNKPFGEEPAVIFEEQTITIDPNEGAAIQLSETVNVGDLVTVEWNGTAYTRIAVATDTCVFVGNASIMGGDDTGEPFALVVLQTYGQIIPADGSESATVRISAPVVKKLDKKYYEPFIPLYVDATDSNRTYLYRDAQLTEKVSSDELLSMEKQAPIVIYFSGLGLVQSGVAYPQEIAANDGNWYVVTTRGKHYTAEYTPET